MAYLVDPDVESVAQFRNGLLTFDSLMSSHLADGHGVISGVVEVDGDPGLCAAVLINESNGAPMGMMLVDELGAYSFTGVSAGPWAVAIIDRTGTMRARIIHTDID